MSAPTKPGRLFVSTLMAGVLLLGSAAGAFGAASTPITSPSTPSSTTNVVTEDDGEGPQFYSGSVIDVSDTIQGDVYVAGQNVTVSGEVTGDVIVAAQTINITGTVDGNVRLAAQDVVISGEVQRSGTVFAASVNLTEEGSLGADLVGAAGEVGIDGSIDRDVVISAEGFSIDGSVGGDVTYYSDQSASIADGAVAGSVERIAPDPTPEAEPSAWGVFLGWALGLLYALVALSLITLVAVLVFPRRLTEVTNQLKRSPWKALLVGFVAAIAVPVALLLLMITIIGAPLALAGILVWVLMTLATFIYSSYAIGRLVFRDAQRPVVMALVGGVILIVALHVPWLNIAVWLAMVLFGLGAQLLDFYDRRPRRVPPEPYAEPAAATTVP